MYLDDFKVGMEIELPPVVIDRQQMTEFAERYDAIPMHLDEEYARKTRFGAIIAPGVMSCMAVWGKFKEMNIFGDALIAGKSMNIEWHLPVYPEDVLHGTVRISGITRRNPYNGIIETTMLVRNQRGEPVLTCVSESVVKCR